MSPTVVEVWAIKEETYMYICVYMYVCVYVKITKPLQSIHSETQKEDCTEYLFQYEKPTPTLCMISQT